VQWGYWEWLSWPAAGPSSKTSFQRPLNLWKTLVALVCSCSYFCTFMRCWVWRCSPTKSDSMIREKLYRTSSQPRQTMISWFPQDLTSMASDWPWRPAFAKLSVRTGLWRCTIKREPRQILQVITSCLCTSSVWWPSETSCCCPFLPQFCYKTLKILNLKRAKSRKKRNLRKNSTLKSYSPRRHWTKYKASFTMFLAVHNKRRLIKRDFVQRKKKIAFSKTKKIKKIK